MFDPKQFLQAQRWLPFRNDSGMEIPAYGVVQNNQDLMLDNEKGVFRCIRPNNSHNRCFIYCNGPAAVPDGGLGFCTRDFPALAKCDSATVGECGVDSGSFSLSDSRTGFYKLGAGPSGLAYVVLLR